jgi:hypothetical protein
MPVWTTEKSLKMRNSALVCDFVSSQEKNSLLSFVFQLTKYDTRTTLRFETYDNGTNGGMKKMWS